MSLAVPAPASAMEVTKPAWLNAASTHWPMAAVVAIVLMQATMIVTRSINWDEFWFYYHVSEFDKGMLTQPLQSLHVRLFAWLTQLPGNSIDHIVAGRTVMLGCEVAVIASIYAIARKFTGKAEALVACLLYVSMNFVFQHGFSFRTDPMAAAGLMGALAVLTRCKLDLKAIATFAALVAISGMITIKIILYAPAFIGIAWLRWSESGHTISTAARLVLAAISAIAIFAALYAWHAAALTQATSGAGMASSASSWMFFLGVPPYWQMIVKAVQFSPVFALFIAIAPFAIWRSDLTNAAKIALTGLWLPVLTPAFYTNTAGYFYVFMLAPVAVGCVIAIKTALQRYSPMLVSLVLLVIVAGLFAIEDRSVIERQRSIITAANSVLPEGSAYFDHNGMLPAMDKANYLMTPSALSAYRETGVASYRAEMESRPVSLLLVNEPLLEMVLEGDDRFLLPADAEALRGNYVQMWGPLYIAGQEFSASTETTHEFLVPGPYTVTGGAIRVDGKDYAADAIVQITRGLHTIAPLDGTVRLQWGEHIAAPANSWNEGPLYVDF